MLFLKVSHCWPQADNGLTLLSIEPGQVHASAGIPILTSRLGRPASTAFKYEPLDPLVDSIRLLVLLRGSKDDDVACELIHKTFGSKPKYEALSYTRGDPSNLDLIHLHDSLYEIRETLFRAKFHLHSKTEKRLIWVDAIYIDQNNVEERGNQVRLMPFIYGRAQVVVVWLGTPIPTFYDDSRTQFMNDHVETLCNHLYWRRIWIIQEIPRARNMIISFSNATFNWTELRLSFGRTEDTRLPKLYHPIENRHDDKNQLVLFMERFSTAQCGEMRDKIYGFVRLAHDCYDGSIKADYSASLYDTFADAVKCHSAAKPLEGPFYYSWEKHRDIDRLARFVRFAQLAQRESDGAVDITARCRITEEDLQRLFYARGYIAEMNVHLGVSYNEYVSSFAAERQWKLSQDTHYTNIADLATLREMDDIYAAELLEKGETDLAKIRQIHSESSFGF